MIIVKNFTDFKNAADQWNPLLTDVISIDEASDNINFPHEDYPQFVDNTKKAIKETILLLKERALTERDIQFIHTICMKGKEYLTLGEWRKIKVQVSNELIPPQPYLIPSMMMSILPVGTEYQETKEDVIQWYKEFETIHPFEDGNGRVGGIVLAAITYLLTGKYTVSKIEPHYVINPILKRITDDQDPLLNNPKYFNINMGYGDRCIKYLEAKIDNIKFNKILTDTNNLDKITKLIKQYNIIDIVKLLENIR